MNNQVKCYKKGEEVTLPLLKITPAELDTMLLEHTAPGGGYGWVMVEDIDREFCRVAGIATRLRTEIKSGKKKVVGSHIL